MSEKTKATFFKAISRILLKPIFGPPFSYGLQRTWFEWMASASQLPKGSQCKNIIMGTVKGEKVTHALSESNALPTGAQTVILYLHGGAYCICSPKTHRSLTANLAKHCQVSVFVPDYRLAPENPFPAGIDDCLASYQWLLEQGYNASQIIIAGDSAGGGLVMATTQRIKALKLAPPAGLVLISPWVDMTLASKNSVSDKIDPLLRWSNIEAGVKSYLQGHDPKDPLASAVLADLKDFPPMLVQVGSEEILLNDARKINQRAKQFNLDITLTEYQGAWHVFQLQAGLLKMADLAIEEIYQFISSTQARKQNKEVEC